MELTVAGVLNRLQEIHGAGDGATKATKEPTPSAITSPYPAKPWAVTLTDSALGEPVVFVSGPEAAAWPEVEALGFPVFDRAEMAALFDGGASVAEWKDAMLVKKGIPGSHVDGFEKIGGEQ